MSRGQSFSGDIMRFLQTLMSSIIVSSLNKRRNGATFSSGYNLGFPAKIMSFIQERALSLRVCFIMPFNITVEFCYSGKRSIKMDRWITLLSCSSLLAVKCKGFGY